MDPFPHQNIHISWVVRYFEIESRWNHADVTCLKKRRRRRPLFAFQRREPAIANKKSIVCIWGKATFFLWLLQVKKQKTKDLVSHGSQVPYHTIPYHTCLLACIVSFQEAKTQTITASKPDRLSLWIRITLRRCCSRPRRCHKLSTTNCVQPWSHNHHAFFSTIAAEDGIPPECSGCHYNCHPHRGVIIGSVLEPTFGRPRSWIM